jgi:hypothetical protein
LLESGHYGTADRTGIHGNLNGIFHCGAEEDGSASGSGDGIATGYGTTDKLADISVIRMKVARLLYVDGRELRKKAIWM